MQAKLSNLLNGCTLIGLGIVFLSFCWSGRIDPYLNPCFRPLVPIGGILTIIVGIIRLLAIPQEHCCTEHGCHHSHHGPLWGSLVCFTVIFVSVLAGGTFSKDAFDQQIYVNRGSVEDDSRIPGTPAASTVFPFRTFDGTRAQNGAVPYGKDQMGAAQHTSDTKPPLNSGDSGIAVEITDLLRANAIEPLRNSIAGKNVSVVGQFVPGSTDKKFRLTRMFIWCCAADARPIHVTVDVSAPVNVPDLQWVKVVGTPEYSVRNGREHLVLKADSVAAVKPPKEAMLY